MLPEEDRVLIKVLRVEKGYGTKRIMNEFTRWDILQERIYRCRIRDVDHLKKRLIEEWCHVDHCIIDRAVNQVNQWQKRLRRCIREKLGHLYFNIKL